jgi:hypothetical protein
MKKVICAIMVLAIGGTAFGMGRAKPVDTDSSAAFVFPAVGEEHVHMQQLLANAMGYINPEHGLFDETSGYPVEGWNHDPSKGLFLRSFTQLTSIGEWTELLANIVAGYADNPYVSREEALEKLEQVIDTLLADQADPTVSAKGLLGNFLGLENGKRLGPLGEDVSKSSFVEAFGADKADKIWKALAEVKWIVPVRDGNDAKIKRSSEYGSEYFKGPLKPFADDAVKYKIMEILDERVVKIIFLDNVNMTSSLAKTVGALMHPNLAGNKKAAAMIEKLESFMDAQKEGYDYLFDPETDTFIFGWDATNDQFVGWEGGGGVWVIGHNNMFINEARGPFMFCAIKYDFPVNAVKNAALMSKPYRALNGKDIYTLATWDGSAFQSIGLTSFMQEPMFSGWEQNLKNSVNIQLDLAKRLGNPGFLTESYSGNGTEYTGGIGVQDVAVSAHHKLTDAPSLYTLGVAYMYEPEKMEEFLEDNWENIGKLFTDHGPWEGYNTSSNAVIEFQTSAHTMSLILGGINSGHENMKRYLDANGLMDKLVEFNTPGEAVNLLDESVQWLAWTSAGDQLVPYRSGSGFQIRGDEVHTGGITVVVPQEKGISLSNGILKIRYCAANPIEKAVITLKRVPGLPIKPMVFENEIYTRFDVALGHENTIEIPMPGMPGLDNIKELIVVYGDDNIVAPVDLTITGFEFVPAL